jgi:uncharacterized membrane protein
VPAGLLSSYEVGRLAAAIGIKSKSCTTVPDLKGLLSLGEIGSPATGGPSAGALSPNKGTTGPLVKPDKESTATRLHELLAGLHAAFPGGAAYAVSRHLEDWSAWVNNKPVEADPNVLPQQLDDPSLPAARAALAEQSRIWWTLLSGEVLGRSFTGALSWADAADHLLLFWSARAHSLLSNLWRTLFGKVVSILFVLVVVAFFAVIFLNIFPPSGAHPSTGVSIVAVIAAAVGSGGLLHVTRTQVQSAVSRLMDSVGPPAIEAEVAEAIAQGTRRLPGDSAAGASQVANLRSAGARLRRARRAGFGPETG